MPGRSKRRLPLCCAMSRSVAHLGVLQRGWRSCRRESEAVRCHARAAWRARCGGVELLGGLRGVGIFGRGEVRHDGFEQELRMLREARGECGKRGDVIPLECPAGPCRYRFPDAAERAALRIAGTASANHASCCSDPSTGVSACANSLCRFAFEEAGEQQRAMAFQLRLQEARFIQAGDGEPVAAFVSKTGRAPRRHRGRRRWP